jgi:Uma2 family endonuclease
MATTSIAWDQRVVLRNVSWETYEKLLEDLIDSCSPRLTFDRGNLEIMTPTAEHERLNRLLASFVEIAADAVGAEIENLGSTTFRRSDLEQGFEPDSCF